MRPLPSRIATRWLQDDYWNRMDRFAKTASEAHDKSVALMKFLSGVAKSLGPEVGRHTYVVGGAVRDFVLDRPIKDVDVVIDSVALGGKKDSEWFAKQVVRAIPAQVNMVTNQYGVALLNITGSWVLDGLDMKGEDIEIANARSESYGGEGGKGYKPHQVAPSTIEEDVVRRELTYNTLLLRLIDLASGPDKKDIVDLTGCGLRDLEQGVMQCPQDPNKVFADDPSRMVRVIKFALRYGHKLTPDTKAAILRNAGKLKNVPASHLSQMLTQIVLKEPTWQKALEMMGDLGLLAPVREMLLEDQGFRTTMEHHLKSQKMDMLFGLAEVGLPLGAAISFLSGPEQIRLREIALGMDRDEAWEFLGMVKNPGNAYKDKNFAPALAAQYGIKGKALGQFMPLIMTAGRELLLSDPPLAHDPTRLKRLIEDRVERAMPQTRQASSLHPGDFVKLTHPRGLGEVGVFQVVSLAEDLVALARATVWESNVVRRTPVGDLQKANPTYEDLLGHTYYQAAKAIFSRVENGADLKSALRKAVTLRGAPREVLDVIEQMVNDGLRGRKIANGESSMSDTNRQAALRRAWFNTTSFEGKIPGGVAEKKHKKPEDFDPKEFELGVKVEREHLVGGGWTEKEMEDRATEITMDHLTEIKDYYTRLKKMEEAAKKDKKAAASLTKDQKREVYDLLISGKGKAIPDSKIHALAEKMGVNTHELEGFIYGLASQQAILQSKEAAVLDGDTTGDGTRVGLFIPLPLPLAEQYPDLGDEDDSPPHVTLLYVGTVEPGKEDLFLEVLAETLRDEPGPIRAWTNGVDSFTHPHAERTVFYTPIRFSRDLGELRDRLWVALEDAGFDIQHKFPLAFFPHTTLAYVDGLHPEHGYQGEVPDGAWEFDAIQVWGLPKDYNISLGSFQTSEKDFQDLRQRGEVEAWLRKEWGSVLPKE